MGESLFIAQVRCYMHFKIYMALAVIRHQHLSPILMD
jgi:hypothetical protein